MFTYANRVANGNPAVPLQEANGPPAPAFKKEGQAEPETKETTNEQIQNGNTHAEASRSEVKDTNQQELNSQRDLTEKENKSNETTSESSNNKMDKSEGETTPKRDHSRINYNDL